MALILPVLAIGGVLFYVPPLLDDRPYNLPGRFYDFFAHAYHSTRAQWLGNESRAGESRRHHPARLRELWPGELGGLSGLGRKYFELGLEGEARSLFRAALDAVPAEEGDPLETVSYLALLEDWPAAAGGAREYLRTHPESAEGKYWLGRALLEIGCPEEARPLLESAYRKDESLLDALYHAARAEEKSGRREIALVQYEKLVSVLPRHLEAWHALECLYEKNSEPEKQRNARERIRELSPPRSFLKKINNETVLLGYDFNRDKLEPEDSLSLDLYLKGWRPAPADKVILARLISVDFWGGVEKRSEAFPIRAAGEVAKQTLTWESPFHLYPGNYRLEIALEKPARAGEACATGQKGEYHALTVLPAAPRWLPAHTRESLIRQYFGATAHPLGKRSFLGPGVELDLEVAGEGKIAALGMVSSAQCYSSFPQGREIARVIVSAGEDEFEFPVRMGIETAKCWWEAATTGMRKHRQAMVFRTWPVNNGEGNFRAFEYRAVFPLPQPLVISGLRVKNTSENAGLSIADIILVPEESGSGAEPEFTFNQHRADKLTGSTIPGR